MNTASTKQSVMFKRVGEIRLFLLDLDGTLYLENELIPGALQFIENIRRRGTQYVFLTNNSSRNAHEYHRKLSGMGFALTYDNVFTSGQATALYLAARASRPRVFLCGTASLESEFQEYGIRLTAKPTEPADFVVVGFDRELDYRKLEIACELIDKGVPFVATNPDLVCPIRDGRYIPDCGSMCRMITNATGKEPLYIGKPQRRMVDILSHQKGVAKKRIAMIGDRLYTDIALGVNAGITTFCVLTGESDRAAIRKSPYKPDFTIESIDVLNRNFS